MVAAQRVRRARVPPSFSEILWEFHESFTSSPTTYLNGQCTPPAFISARAFVPKNLASFVLPCIPSAGRTGPYENAATLRLSELPAGSLIKFSLWLCEGYMKMNNSDPANHNVSWWGNAERWNVTVLVTLRTKNIYNVSEFDAQNTLATSSNPFSASLRCTM